MTDYRCARVYVKISCLLREMKFADHEVRVCVESRLTDKVSRGGSVGRFSIHCCVRVHEVTHVCTGESTYIQSKTTHEV